MSAAEVASNTTEAAAPAAAPVVAAEVPTKTDTTTASASASAPEHVEPPLPEGVPAGKDYMIHNAGYIVDGQFPAPGLKKTVRHITGYDAEGKSVFLSTDCGDHHMLMGDKQAVANILYSTSTTPVNFADNSDIKFAKETPPPLHYQQGTVVRMIDFAPGVASPMHRALSLDYGVVVEGEFELILDSGDRRIMRQGDFCVQRATAHCWRNVSGGGTLPGRMLWILLGCEDVVVAGKSMPLYLGELAEYYEDKEH